MNKFSYQGKSPTISPKAKILQGAIITGEVILKDFVSVWFNAVIRGDMSGVTIGEFTNVQDNAMIHTNTNKPTLIGSNVTIGHGAIIHACTIGNNALIGMGSVILDGAVIGDGAMIGAGTIVPPGKVIPPKMLAYGNPMQITRQLTEAEINANIQNSVNYVVMSKQYPDGE